MGVMEAGRDREKHREREREKERECEGGGRDEEGEDQSVTLPGQLSLRRVSKASKTLHWGGGSECAALSCAAFET